MTADHADSGLRLADLVASFSLLLLINVLTWQRSKRLAGKEER